MFNVIQYERSSKRLTIPLLDFTYIAHYKRSTEISKVIKDFYNSFDEFYISKKDICIIDLETTNPIDQSKSLKHLDFTQDKKYGIGLCFKIRFTNIDKVEKIKQIYPHNTPFPRIIEEFEKKFGVSLGDCKIIIDNTQIPYRDLKKADASNTLEKFIATRGNRIKISRIIEIPPRIQSQLGKAALLIKQNHFEKAIAVYENAHEMASRERLLELMVTISSLKAKCKSLYDKYKSTPPEQIAPPGSNLKSPFDDVKHQLLSSLKKLPKTFKFSVSKDSLHPPKPGDSFQEKGEDFSDEGRKVRVAGKMEQTISLRDAVMNELGRNKDGKVVVTASTSGKKKKEKFPPPPPPTGAPGSQASGPPEALPGGGTSEIFRTTSNAPPPGAGAGSPSSPKKSGGKLRGSIMPELKSLFRMRSGSRPSASPAPLITYNINLGMQYYSVMMAKQSYLFYLYLSHKELHIEVEEGKEVYETTFTVTTTKEEPPLFKIHIRGKGFKVNPLSSKVAVDKDDKNPGLVIFSITPKKVKKKKEFREERRSLHVYVEFEKKIVNHTILSVVVQPKHFSVDLGPFHLSLSKGSAKLISFVPLLITTISALYTIFTYDFSGVNSSSSSSLGFLGGMIPGFGSIVFFATFAMTILKKGVFPIKQKWTSFMDFDDSPAMMK